MATVTDFLSDLFLKLLARAFAKALERYHSEKVKVKSEAEVDQKLERFKASYAKAFDGTPLTKEQRDQLRRDIADFLRGDAAGGL